jgi:hypothetical protein
MLGFAEEDEQVFDLGLLAVADTELLANAGPETNTVTNTTKQ